MVKIAHVVDGFNAALDRLDVPECREDAPSAAVSDEVVGLRLQLDENTSRDGEGAGVLEDHQPASFADRLPCKRKQLQSNPKTIYSCYAGYGRLNHDQ
jgi:hypothetical protein